MSAPETMPFANARLAWAVLERQLPTMTVAQWGNVVATLKLFFSHNETGRLQDAAPDLLAACEAMLKTFTPSTWAGCSRPGDWMGPNAERCVDTEAECPCLSHQLIRTARAAVLKARAA